ncbi:unnamed protein product [Soboliphyme baturini]|uniref:Uncharacterized protein n=1 Tax=Soboliphyme baturini TaxID=241478 RepID=A0A183IPP1_9BILA|nr:unnamed protein product [Soboliphyme baturini]
MEDMCKAADGSFLQIEIQRSVQCQTPAAGPGPGPGPGPASATVARQAKRDVDGWCDLFPRRPIVNSDRDSLSKCYP